ncbi:tryptophan halogenase family protein [Pseudoxanthomonas mexicana]
MSEHAIKTVVIVGGGTAGWMTAAALSKVLGESCAIRLVESEAIGTVGVGEGTIPHIRLFNSLLQIDEVDFVRKTQGTFKLGVQFNNWGRIGDTYVHGFGNGIGQNLGLLPFHQFWIKAARGGKAEGIGSYVLSSLAAPQGKFMVSANDVPQTSPLANIAYAYHFDAGLYARYLRSYSEQRGVKRIEGIVTRVSLDSESGHVDAIELDSGETVHGDLFVDCSGFRGLLIEEALETGYVSFKHWLPCDRALAVPCENVGPPTPYTRATAREAGWQWRIPLQHRTGNGYVYSSAHISDDEAAATLLKNLDGRALDDPRPLRFVTGRRKRFWNKNVVAIGLSSGFVEPLEATSIYSIQSGIMRLLSLFPRHGFNPTLIDRYNAQMVFDFERIRDFLILHYHATQRDDTAFWRQCRDMPIPQELDDVITLFRDSGRFYRNGEEMFAEMSWVQVMLGQGILPQSYHPLVDQLSDEDLSGFVSGVGRVVANCVDAMPSHQAFIDRYCKAALM